MFIILDIWPMRARMPVYAVSSPDTSTSVLPLPRAMRRRREGILASSSGCSRSCAVHVKCH